MLEYKHHIYTLSYITKSPAVNYSVVKKKHHYTIPMAQHHTTYRTCFCWGAYIKLVFCIQKIYQKRHNHVYLTFWSRQRPLVASTNVQCVATPSGHFTTSVDTCGCTWGLCFLSSLNVATWPMEHNIPGSLWCARCATAAFGNKGHWEHTSGNMGKEKSTRHVAGCVTTAARGSISPPTFTCTAWYILAPAPTSAKLAGKDLFPRRTCESIRSHILASSPTSVVCVTKSLATCPLSSPTLPGLTLMLSPRGRHHTNIEGRLAHQIWPKDTVSHNRKIWHESSFWLDT